MIKTIFKKLLSEKHRRILRKQFQKVIAPIYYGDAYHCNCCDKKFRKFFTKGYQPRLNARCPFCSSLERTRVLDLYLQKEAQIYQAENISILHFAPEYALSHNMCRIKHLTYIDADLNPLNARHVVDITHIPFPENHFDYIICSHVLGHVPNEPLAIQEMHRVLKPEGMALILTLLGYQDKTFENPNIDTPAARLKAYGEPDLCRLHGKDFAQRLQDQGFMVEEIDYRLTFPPEFQKTHALGNGEREKIFKCTKSKTGSKDS
jgi:SAM-dependent methyltransferase